MSNTAASSVVNGSWIETTLGKLAEYITSGSRDWSRYYADAGAIFIRTQDINQNRLSLKEVAFVKLPEKVEGKRSLVRKGDLLVTITGANVGKVAVVEGAIPEAYVSQSVCLVRLKDPSLAKFVHLQLTAKRGDKTTVEAMAYGLGRPVLNLENIRSAPIRLAPAKVQVVIVAEIEKQFSRIDEAVATLKRVKANLKRYKSSVLKAAVEGKLTEDWRKQHPNVEPASKLLERILAERRAKWNGRGKYKESSAPESTDLPTLPKGWTWATVEQLASGCPGAIQSGPFGSQLLHSEFIDDGILAIGIDNVLDGKFSLGRQHRISPEKFKTLGKFTARPRDVVITVMATVGRVCVLPQRLEPAIITKHCYRITPLPGNVDSEFLAVALRADSSTRQYIFGNVRGQTRPGINGPILKAAPVSLPPFIEQKEIVAEVECSLSVIEELESAVEANLTRADRLRQGTLQWAFNGKLL
ncbi:MAG: restriction endonuclease subunit S [Nitrospiraceae bacterium]